MITPTILRVRKETHYTVISNYPITDKSLSAEALGVLVYLLSKPDNWIVYNNEVQRRFNIRRKKFDRILAELKKAGYVQRQRRQNETGNFFYETVVSEVPLSLLGTTEYPLFKQTVVPFTADGKPADGKPADGKRDNIVSTDSASTDSASTEDGKTTYSSSEEKEEKPSSTSLNFNSQKELLLQERLNKLDVLAKPVLKWPSKALQKLFAEKIEPWASLSQLEQFISDAIFACERQAAENGKPVTIHSIVRYIGACVENAAAAGQLGNDNPTAIKLTPKEAEAARQMNQETEQRGEQLKRAFKQRERQTSEYELPPISTLSID